MSEFRFTRRMKRILEISNEITTPGKIIEPVHLFIGACKEGTGVCGELYLYLSRRIGTSFITDISNIQEIVSPEEFYMVGQFKVSTTSKQVLDQAQEIMIHYN